MRKPRTPAEAGFTLLELIIVSTIIIAASAAGYPAFSKWKKQAELVGTAREATLELQAARIEAIRSGFPVVAVPNEETGEMFIFANVDRDEQFLYQPDTSATPRTADYQVGEFQIPKDLPFELRGPDTNGGGGGGGGGGSSGGGDTPDDDAAIWGLTEDGNGVQVLVFRPNGTVVDEGGLRIADGDDNVLEVRVHRTGRFEVLKWNGAPKWDGDPGYYPNFRHQGSDQPMWDWS